MIISNQKNPFDNITIRDSIRTKVSTVKFLGVTLDENLTLNDLVNKVTTKISMSVGVMRRLSSREDPTPLFSGVFPSLLAWDVLYPMYCIVCIV